MSDSEGPDTAMTSATAVFPVDRSGLQELEASMGQDNALASCRFGNTTLAVINDPKEADLSRGTVVLRAADSGWIEVERTMFWTDALRVLGRLLDEEIELIPVDPIDRPSPTLVIPCEDGIELIYRTPEGVRVARELDEGFVPRFEVYDLLWKTFAAATDDEASGSELQD
jgi:hypothetical protein